MTLQSIPQGYCLQAANEAAKARRERLFGDPRRAQPETMSPQKWRELQRQKREEEQRAEQAAIEEKRRIELAAAIAKATQEHPIAPVHVRSKPTTIKGKITMIQARVAEHYATEERPISVQDILSPRRFAFVIMPRQVAVYIVHKSMKLSTTALGRYFGGRDHTTILHSIGKISRLIQSDQKLAAEIDGLRQQILDSLAASPQPRTDGEVP